jgi:hypothetical protein
MNMAGEKTWQKINKDNKVVQNLFEKSRDSNFIYLTNDAEDFIVEVPVAGNNANTSKKRASTGQSGKIDAALGVDGYLFKIFYGNTSVVQHPVHGPLEPERLNYAGLNGQSIDAALNYGNGKFYLFVGANYFRGTLATNTIDAGYPKPITNTTWPGLPWTDGIDAAMNYGNGKVYFFKGDQYCRYDIAADAVDENYPMSIKLNWPGVTFPRIDAAVSSGEESVLFFYNDQYIIYDIETDQAITTPAKWNDGK